MLKIYLYFLCLFGLCLFSYPSLMAGVPPRLAHSLRYDDQSHYRVDVSQYLVSEKLDGVRGYWDGQRLWSRSGRIIHAPDWFTAGWPSVALDGELWRGRGHFDETSGTIRRHKPDDNAWRQLSFMLFDLHDQPGEPQRVFLERLRELGFIVERAKSPYLKLIPQISVADEAGLQVLLAEAVRHDGEGLMLHRRDALYQVGRSRDILKLKPYWDAEARVLAHLPGKGKYRGLLGALQVEGVSESRSRGRYFKIGTGFSDAERADPPSLGTIITYRFQGYTGTGLPRFARYLRRRQVAPFE